MQVSLRQLHIFTAIAQEGSTAAAAKYIALSQSATSAALKGLEEILGVQLFDRVGKRLVLNENGRLLLPQARQMLDTANTIEQQFKPTQSPGVGLHIGASTTIGIYLLPRLLSLPMPASSPPRVMVANTANIAAAVARFDLDVGLIEGPCHEDELVVEPWIEDEMVLVCAPHHPILPASPSTPISVNALRNAQWLLREQGSGTQEAVAQLLLPHLHQLRPSIEFSNSEAIKQAAIAGLGITCLSRSIVHSALRTDELVELTTTLPYLSRRFYLIHHQNKTLSLQLTAFLEHCRKLPAFAPS